MACAAVHRTYVEHAESRIFDVGVEQWRPALLAEMLPRALRHLVFGHALLARNEKSFIWDDCIRRERRAVYPSAHVAMAIHQTTHICSSFKLDRTTVTRTGEAGYLRQETSCH